MNLYVVQSIRGRGSIATVIVGMLPFLGCILLLTALIMAFPQIVNWLPNRVHG